MTMKISNLHKMIATLPAPHQGMFWLCFVVLCWQGLYLAEFFGESLYSFVERPVQPPDKCEFTPDLGQEAEGMDPGEVHFVVDMRCSVSNFSTVFVTTPLCGDCDDEGWNELQDENGDGIYEGSIQFVDTITDSPLVGAGLMYRYGVTIKSESGFMATYPENLLPSSSNDVSCAPSSDGMTYAYRTLVTDSDGTEVKDIFGSCTSVPIPAEEWDKIRDEEWRSANSFLYEHVDPWWKPTSEFLTKFQVVPPILFLTFCSLLYVYATFSIGGKYVGRKEAALHKALEEANNKNSYLEHAAKILRHDMHSGINTYIPRGIRSLERRLEKVYSDGVGSEFLSKDHRPMIEDLHLEAPLRLLKEGLTHTQKVYAGVTEFTNLVKAGSKIKTKPHDVGEILRDYLDTVEYKSEVIIDDNLPTLEVNAPLFCTALDNLIRNGLKYNDSASRMVTVTKLDEHHIAVLDNGRGMSQEEFLEFSKPYTRKVGQQENGTGLGLNICIAILNEHGFSVSSSVRPEGGTEIKVRVS